MTIKRILTVLVLIATFIGALVFFQAKKATAIGLGEYYVEDNPSCETLADDPYFDNISSPFGFKLNGAPEGTWTLTTIEDISELTGEAPEDPANSVTISNVVGDMYFDWTATLGIDAVIVKGGPDADVYVYVPEEYGDTGLHAPMNNGEPYGLSHIEFCFDYELDVSKTAETTFTRTWEWTIDKSVSPESWDLFTGDSGASQYTLTATKGDYLDSDWAVSGSITIENNTPLEATMEGVTDVVSEDITATVDCVGAFPHTLPAGDTLVCSYETGLPDGSPRANTANVTTSGVVGGGDASVDVTLGDPTTVFYDSINVDDPNGGTWLFNKSGSVNYEQAFTCDEDDGTKDNIATVRETGQSASASVIVHCHALEVTKEASTSLTRTWNWTIDKGPDGEYWKFIGDAASEHTYAIQVTKTGSTDKEWVVNGKIRVNNPAPMAAMVNSVADVVSPGIAADVDCGDILPYTLVAGYTLECDYEADLPDDLPRTNTGTATIQNFAYDFDLPATPSGTTDFSGQLDFDFSNPLITEESATVNVTDDFGSPGESGDDKTFGPFADTGEGGYSRDFSCPTDPVEYVNGYKKYTITNTAVIDETSESDEATVTVHCYTPLVSKDANTSFTRAYTWMIEKSADQTDLTLASGQQFQVNYDVDLSETYTDSDWAVSGTITLQNPNPKTKMDVTLADVVSPDITADLDCEGVLMVPAGGLATCGYNAGPPNAAPRSNTATATLNGINFTGKADVIFGDPTTEVDECIDVTDDQYGPLGPGPVCYSDLPQTFSYSMYVGPYLACGDYTFTNVASFVTNGTSATGFDPWTVNINVKCGGCTRTPGYWKNHSEYGPAPYDDTWALMPDGADTLFFGTGQSWYEVMWTPPKGNAYYILARAYAAAVLNQLNGSSVPPAVQGAIEHATALLEEYDGNPKGIDVPKGKVRQDFVDTAEILDDYNNGRIGPGHCKE